jgi:hypothetical protein
MSPPPADNPREIADAAAALPDEKLAKLVSLLEMGRARPELDGALALLRPRLAKLRPPRRLGVRRLLFLPVEDLLEDVARYRRDRGRVSREILDPVWELFRAHADPAVLARAEAEAAAADPARADAADRAGAPLWAHAAGVLGELAARGGGASAHWPRAFARSEDVRAQLGAVVEALGVAEEIQRLKRLLPGRPVEALSERDREVLREAIARVGQASPAGLRPLLLALCARVRRPGEVLAVLARAGGGGDKAAYERLSHEIGGAIVERYVEAAAEGGRALAGAPMRDLVGFAERVTEGVSSVAELMGDALDARARGRVQGAFQGLRDLLVSGVVDPAEERLVALLDDALGAGEGGRDGRVALAEEAAATFRRCLALAPKVGFAREARRRAQAVVEGVERHAERLIRDARSRDARSGRADPAGLELDVVTALRVVELAAGPDDAESLLARLRGRFGGF